MRSSPLASAGLDGIATCKPGVFNTTAAGSRSVARRRRRESRSA